MTTPIAEPVATKVLENTVLVDSKILSLFLLTVSANLLIGSDSPVKIA